MKKLDKAEQQLCYNNKINIIILTNLLFFYQHCDLQQSLTKQANDWVSQRRKSKDRADHTLESGITDLALYCQCVIVLCVMHIIIRQIEPVPVLGASERT